MFDELFLKFVPRVRVERTADSTRLHHPHYTYVALHRTAVCGKVFITVHGHTKKHCYSNGYGWIVFTVHTLSVGQPTHGHGTICGLASI